LEWRRRVAARNGDGFTSSITLTEAELQQFESQSQQQDNGSGLRQFMAFVPLILVAVMNKYLSTAIKQWYPNGFDFNAIGLANYTVDVAKTSAIWAVGLALIVGIITAIMFDYRRVSTSFKEGVNASIGGSLLAVMNTASEYGFGAIIAALPGFAVISHALGHTFSNPLVNGAVTTTVLAGITGSASGGMSIALSAMADQYNAAIAAMGIPAEVMHRIVAMASGGMDTLPHNGAVITLLAVTGLTHKQSYKDIFAITIIKTIAVFVAIAAFTWFGIV
jgi:H+/gluconate symporter-like permease